VVLTFIQHFYLHSLPPTDARIIPRPIALPLLFVSAILKIPPLLTYADVVLYNWRIESETSGRSSSSSSSSVPAPIPVPASHNDQPHFNNIRSQATFTHAPDEEEFYLCSARIELRGAQALSLMRVILDEIFIGDDIAVRRTTKYLSALARVIRDMKTLLEGLKTRCDPDRYYNDVRPWLCGQDADVGGRKWVFEGLFEDGVCPPSSEKADYAEGVGDAADIAIAEPTELSGPSAGQSSVIHVLDVFLGVNHESSDGKPSFMTRMKAYMPYQHRLFIDHLASYPRSLREFVMARQGSREGELKKAYNEAVKALKVFRDAHMIMAALYILGPARRARDRAAEVENSKAKEVPERKPHIGTGGTQLVSFLKDTRTRTMRTIIPES
jgi:indoleamine 2,3-dioxygenase